MQQIEVCIILLYRKNRFVLFTSSLEALSRYLLFKRSTNILDILACDKKIAFIIYTIVKRWLLLDASGDY